LKFKAASHSVSSVLRPCQHSIGYMGDGFLQVKRPNQQYHYWKRCYKRESKQRKQL